jgi:hypothetical protein
MGNAPSNPVTTCDLVAFLVTVGAVILVAIGGVVVMARAVLGW